MSDGRATWRRLGEELAATDAAIGWSTMMGFPCLRYEGAFFASLDHRNGDLVVKLPADDVAARVDAGSGKPFAPAGKVFREWLAITPSDDDTWRTAMADALAFAKGG